MIGSRVKAILGAAAFGALILPAAAQWIDPKPPVLGPGDYPPEATEDPPDPGSAATPDKATGAPRQLSSGTEVQALPSPGLSQPAPVEIGALGTPEGPPVGTLDPAGGFGERLWAGSDRGTMEDLLRQTPIASADPVSRELVRRVVLTKAPPPPGQAKRAFVSTRIAALLDAGLIDDAGALAAAASVPNDKDFARQQADAVLIANRAGDACGPATASRLSEGETFWLQLRAYCAEVTGDSATAELTRQVLKAQGEDDPLYNALMDALATRKAPGPVTIVNPTAMHVFLYQQVGLPLPESVARKLGTAASLLVMRDGRNPPRVRFEAAERIVLTGAASAAELVKLADAQDLPLGKVANAAAEAPNLPFLAGQALLRRAALIEPRPEEKAKLVAAALSLGAARKASAYAAALQADVIASLKPSASLHLYARPFACALVRTGKYDAAAAWTAGDAVMKAIVALASQDPARMSAMQKDLSAWAAQRDAAATDLVVADPDRDWKVLIQGVTSALHGSAAPLDGDLAAIATKMDRRGEAVLRIAHAIRKRDAHATDGTAIRALVAIGETNAAQALAVETLAQFVPPPPVAAQ